MSKPIATLEAVRNAYDELHASGVAPTADAIIRHIGGGSKSTVTTHLRTVRGEQTSREPTDATAHFLEPLTRQLAQKLWRAAQDQAKENYDSYIRTLHRVQRDLEQELEEAQRCEQLALENLAAAQNDLEEAKNLIADTRIIEGQHANLSKVLTSLHDQANRLFPGMIGDRSALDCAIEIIGTADRELSRVELRQRMIAAGYSSDQSNKARYHARSGNYIVETGADGDDAKIRLTDKGLQKLMASQAGRDNT